MTTFNFLVKAALAILNFFFKILILSTARTLRKKPGIVDKLVVHFLQTFLVKK